MTQYCEEKSGCSTKADAKAVAKNKFDIETVRLIETDAIVDTGAVGALSVRVSRFFDRESPHVDLSQICGA